jgi:hypothetical protein
MGVLAGVLSPALAGAPAPISMLSTQDFRTIGTRAPASHTVPSRNIGHIARGDAAMNFTKHAVVIVALASATCAFAPFASAKSRPDYTDARIVQMESVPCIARDSASQPLTCQEYTIETDLVTYRVRPRDEKHAQLLAIGGDAHFRLVKDKLLLEAPDGSAKEREFTVVSIKPRQVAEVRFKGTY